MCVIADYIQQEKHDRCQNCEINATVGNGKKMKCELKGSVNMKIQGKKW